MNSDLIEPNPTSLTHTNPSNQLILSSPQDHDAALALVSVHKTLSDDPVKDAVHKEDKDMQRAHDLIELHYGVKEKYQQGEGEELRRARADVDAVLRSLERRGSGGGGSRRGV